jgi:hypothetical protein
LLGLKRRLEKKGGIRYHVAAAGKSSNGRTHDSGSWNRGSNPCFPATLKYQISLIFFSKQLDNKIKELRISYWNARK